MNNWKRIVGIGGSVGAATFIVSVVFYIQFLAIPPGGIVSPDESFRADVAMILGASIQPDNTASDALRDRLLTGVKLYKNHNVGRLLLTGDDGGFRSNEIAVMKAFVLAQGVPEKDLLIDGQGYRTYESCKRAKEVFRLRDIAVVTQSFHIKRALYLCQNFGLNAFGVTSDLSSYRQIMSFWIHDLLASAKAWWDINIWQPHSPARNRGASFSNDRRWATLGNL